jgi:hypothetical protein
MLLGQGPTNFSWRTLLPVGKELLSTTCPRLYLSEIEDAETTENTEETEESRCFPWSCIFRFTNVCITNGLTERIGSKDWG